MSNDKTMNWGNFTADGYDARKNEAIYIFNFRILTNEDVIRVKTFSASRILWGNANMPEASSHNVIFDVRGQLIDEIKVQNIKKGILDFLSKKGINKVKIEFKI